MNYNKLTKAQLIARIEELETQTIDYKINQTKEELLALGRDIAWAAERTYALGQKAARQVQDALKSMEAPQLAMPIGIEQQITEYPY